jgi:hypothetical protein
MKILPVRAALIHADRRTDGWTDMKKLIGTFRYLGKFTRNYKANYDMILCSAVVVI